MAGEIKSEPTVRQLNPNQFILGDEPPVWFQVLDLLRQSAWNSPEFQRGTGFVERQYAQGELRRGRRAVNLGYSIDQPTKEGEIFPTKPQVPGSVTRERGPWGMFGQTTGPPTPGEQQLIQLGIDQRYQQSLKEVHMKMQVMAQLDTMMKGHMTALEEGLKVPGGIPMMRDAAAKWGLSDLVEPMIAAAEEEQAKKKRKEDLEIQRKEQLFGKTAEDIAASRTKRRQEDIKFQDWMTTGTGAHKEAERAGREARMRLGQAHSDLDKLYTARIKELEKDTVLGGKYPPNSKEGVRASLLLNTLRTARTELAERKLALIGAATEGLGGSPMPLTIPEYYYNLLKEPITGDEDDLGAMLKGLEPDIPEGQQQRSESERPSAPQNRPLNLLFGPNY